MDYEIKYSDRRTVTIKVRNAKLRVLAPIGTDKAIIDELIYRHRKWISAKIESQIKREAQTSDMTDKDIAAMKAAARIYLRELVERYARLMGAEYNRITITSAVGRFGSCSGEKNLSFSYRLMLYPEAAREYVVVHELAHTFEMNHSDRFYAIVEKTLPDYKERKKLLK